MIIPLVIAALLSLSTTNDYVFTHPDTTNIVGVGSGENGMYTMVRAEDLAFLREAYQERYAAVVSPSATNAYVGNFPEGHHVLVDGWDFLNDQNLSMFMAESFDFTKSWNGRGHVSSFVAPDFEITPVDEHGFFMEVDSNWVLRVIAQTNDTMRSYFPYVSSYGTRIVPPSDLRTNAYGTIRHKIVSLDTITNGYHNLTVMTDILTPPVETYDKSNDVTDVIASYMYTDRIPTFVYTDQFDSHGRVVNRYISDYTLRYDYPSYERRTSQASPTFSQTIEWIKTEAVPIGWVLQNPDAQGSYRKWNSRLLDSYDSRYTYSFKFRYTSPLEYFRFYCPVITADNAVLCTDLKAWAIVGMIRSTHDYARIESYDSISTEEYANYRNYYVGQFEMTQISPDGIHIIPGVSNVVYKSNVPITRAIILLRDYLGESSDFEYVRPVMPNTSSIPVTTSDEVKPDIISATHTIEKSYSIAWLRFIFQFKRDFHAKVLSN